MPKLAITAFQTSGTVTSSLQPRFPEWLFPVTANDSTTAAERRILAASSSIAAPRARSAGSPAAGDGRAALRAYFSTHLNGLLTPPGGTVECAAWPPLGTLEGRSRSGESKSARVMCWGGHYDGGSGGQAMIWPGQRATATVDAASLLNATAGSRAKTPNSRSLTMSAETNQRVPRPAVKRRSRVKPRLTPKQKIHPFGAA